MWVSCTGSYTWTCPDKLIKEVAHVQGTGLFWLLLPIQILMTGAIIVDTYSDQNAVQIHLLAAVHAGASEDVREAMRVVHAQDVDVILAAERLNESEVNLKRHILHIIVVCGQDAQHHVIRVPRQKS